MYELCIIQFGVWCVDVWWVWGFGSVFSVYVYVCTPHVKAGMVALVVVGNDLSNKDAVSEVTLFGESTTRLEKFFSTL